MVMGQVRLDDTAERPLSDHDHLIERFLCDRAHEPLNLAWRWQYVDSAWGITRTSTELCDATPSQVERNLEEWDGRRFCPWNSYVKSEEPVVAGLVAFAPAVA